MEERGWQCPCVPKHSQLFPEEQEQFLGAIWLLCAREEGAGAVPLCEPSFLVGTERPEQLGKYPSGVFKQSAPRLWDPGCKGDLISFINFVACPARDDEPRVLNNPQLTQGMLAFS